MERGAGIPASQALAKTMASPQAATARSSQACSRSCRMRRPSHHAAGWKNIRDSARHCRPFHNQSRRAICASSCASRASSCSAGVRASSDSGSHTTGRSKRAVNGSATSADKRTTTSRAMPMRRCKDCRRACQSAGKGCQGWPSIARKLRRPTAWRSSMKATPSNQASTTKPASGSDCCANTPSTASKSAALTMGKAQRFRCSAGEPQ